MKRLAILGATGSIGRSALAVVDANPGRLQVVGLAAGENAALLAVQIARYRPVAAAVSTAAALGQLMERLGPGGLPKQIDSGREGLIAVATHPDVDVVLCASSGTAALEAVLAAIDAGKTIALANKEVLVMAGSLMMDAAHRKGVAILPVDSEHNAIHQCLHGRRRNEVRRLILTASGGPFRSLPLDELNHVTPDDALRHPTWQMGRKITVDSATLMNKGLEVIEARWLFGMTAREIDVVIHPQSIVHSMVELRDGSVIAQMSVTDMRLPIQYAFSYPDRWDAPMAPLDISRLGTLEFMPPDLQRFPCLRLAYDALRQGGAWPIVLNAANEVAVEEFLQGRLTFPRIPAVIEAALNASDRDSAVPVTLDDVRAVDAWARAFSLETCLYGTIVLRVLVLLTIGAFLLVLGVLIFVHELGHFLVARWYGVRVLTFSLGFGPKILKFTRGDTEYCVSAVPLGGYVKMAGENVSDERNGAPDEFLSKSKWVRFQVYLAGPAMNIFLALIASTVVLAGGADVPIYRSQPPVVGSVEPGSAAQKAGIQPGDRIVSINGHDVPTWDDMEMGVLPQANREISIVFDRGGVLSTVAVVPASETKYELGNLGVHPVLRPQIAAVRPNTPAERAGLRRGDVLLTVGGEKAVTRDQTRAVIRRNGPVPILLHIERQGREMDITVTPEGATGSSIIGFDFYDSEFARIDPTFVQAIKLSFKQNLDNAKVIGQTLKGLATRETKVNQLLGPLAIADLSGSAARLGWQELLGLMAMISLNLALLNLMPIPVMDGGQIVILALEGIARRDFSIKLKERITMAGAAVILLLMTVVIYNDIARILR